MRRIPSALEEKHEGYLFPVHIFMPDGTEHVQVEYKIQDEDEEVDEKPIRNVRRYIHLGG